MTNPNQLEAWDNIQAIAPSLREAIFNYVSRWPSAAFELEVVTGRRQSTIAARFAELANTKGSYDWAPRIFDSGESRVNPETGRKCTVWNIIKPDDGQLDLFPEPDPVEGVAPWDQQGQQHPGSG